MNLSQAIEAARQSPATYVLKSADGAYLYKGSCRDLQKRLRDHQAGRVSHTKNRRPLTMVHHEYFASYTLARQRENFLKSGAGRAMLKSPGDQCSEHTKEQP